ncbi:MAG: DUF1254 domain-containing protein [Hyphomicrobium sp.]
MISPPKQVTGWRLFVAVPLVAAITHIVVTILGMNALSGSAHARLVAGLAPNKMQILMPIGPKHQPLPFLAPDARYAICAFDTATGPIDVNAELSELGWTIGIFRTDGSSAYFAAATPGRVTRIALTIVPDDDRFLGLTAEAQGRVDASAPPLKVAARNGLVVVRAPDKGAAYRAESEAGLARASCTPKTY